MKAIIGAEDWSAASDKFKIGVAALEGDFDKAAKLMTRIGPEDSPNKGDYREWPIFKQFRQSPQFAKAYSEVFGEPWVEVARDSNIPDSADDDPKSRDTVQ